MEIKVNNPAQKYDPNSKTVTAGVKEAIDKAKGNIEKSLPEIIKTAVSDNELSGEEISVINKALKAEGKSLASIKLDMGEPEIKTENLNKATQSKLSILIKSTKTIDDNGVNYINNKTGLMMKWQTALDGNTASKTIDKLVKSNNFDADKYRTDNGYKDKIDTALSEIMNVNKAEAGKFATILFKTGPVSSDEVKELQKGLKNVGQENLLKQGGVENGGIDGKFGVRTSTAVDRLLVALNEKVSEPAKDNGNVKPEEKTVHDTIIGPPPEKSVPATDNTRVVIPKPDKLKAEDKVQITTPKDKVPAKDTLSATPTPKVITASDNVAITVPPKPVIPAKGFPERMFSGITKEKYFDNKAGDINKSKTPEKDLKAMASTADMIDLFASGKLNKTNQAKLINTLKDAYKKSDPGYQPLKALAGELVYNMAGGINAGGFMQQIKSSDANTHKQLKAILNEAKAETEKYLKDNPGISDYEKNNIKSRLEKIEYLLK